MNEIQEEIRSEEKKKKKFTRLKVSGLLCEQSREEIFALQHQTQESNHMMATISFLNISGEGLSLSLCIFAFFFFFLQKTIQKYHKLEISDD